MLEIDTDKTMSIIMSLHWKQNECKDSWWTLWNCGRERK